MKKEKKVSLFNLVYLSHLDSNLLRERQGPRDNLFDVINVCFTHRIGDQHTKRFPLISLSLSIDPYSTLMGPKLPYSISIN